MIATTIPWAGIGAFMAGLGSLLTAVAAIKAARREGRKEAEHEIELASGGGDNPGGGDGSPGGAGSGSVEPGADLDHDD